MENTFGWELWAGVVLLILVLLILSVYGFRYSLNMLLNEADDPARGAPRPVRTKPEFLGKWWSFADVVPNVKPYSSLAAVLVEVEEQVVDKHVVNGEVVLKRVSKVKNLRLGTGSFLSPGQVLTAAHILTEVVPDERNPDRIFISCATRCVCVPVPQYFRHSAELRLDIKRLMRSKNGGVKAKRVQCLSPTLQSQLKAWVQGRPCPPGPDQAILHLTKPALGVEPISVAPETNWNEVDSMIMRYQTAYCFGLTNVPFVDEDLQMVCSVMSKLPIASVAPSNVDFLSGPPNPFTRLEVAGCSFYGMSGAPILSPGPGSDTSNFGTWQIIGTLKGAAPPSEALECETTSFDMWGTCPESEDWLRRTPPITFAEMALLDMAAPKTFVEMAADLYGMIADLFR